ncbi:AI-2E family transporter [Natronoarchaeum sp. GCM10025703]|uniref:AI-2E family transporter n=1 Tax=unclassified Natronoarchaeum TaxID=2620183 RepID=UPI003607E57B
MNRSQSFLLICIALSGLAALLIVLPFVEYVLSAVVLAYVLSPLHRRLVPHLGRQASPLLLIVATVLTAFLPFYYIATALTRDLQNLARGRTGLEIDNVEATLFEQFGLVIDIEQQLMTGARQLLDVLSSGATGFVAFALRTSLGLALLFFLLYYGLKDGPKFVAWMQTNSPLPRDVTDNLFEKIEQTTWGVVIGHISVAFLQGLLGGVALWAAGIPSVAFWTFVMIVLALLPLIGAFLVWGPAALYLAVIGDPVSATFLALYGILVVSMVDNFARPLVIDKRAHLNPGLILVGVFGGVYVLGFVGLFVGPIVLGIFVAMVVTFVEDYDTLAIGEPAIETASASTSVARSATDAESTTTPTEHGGRPEGADDEGEE